MNPAQDLCYLTIAEASQLIKKKSLSPVELAKAHLKRIHAADSQIRSHLTPLEDSALSEARKAEQDIQKGKYKGPLHGIPIALKDIIDTKGVKTTAQSKVLEHRVPTKDATATARLKKAGCILLGKLALNEFAFGGLYASLGEPPRNPWNTKHITGGSSSGSAAALSAGLCMGALGTDTGGSIRSPASLCGVVGLKATYGLISRYGVLPLSWSLDHCGPMARSVEDTALLLQAIAGYDPKDKTTSRVPIPDYHRALSKSVKGIRVGVPADFCFDPRNGIDNDTLKATKKALAELESMGAHVEEVKIPSLEYASIANMIILMGEGYVYHRKNLRSQPANYGEVTRSRLFLSATLTAADYVQAQRARSRAIQEFGKVLNKVDVLAMPTTPKPAPPFKGFDPMALMVSPSYRDPFNLTWLPAVSVPCGFNAAGLPIGLQIGGRAFDESRVLKVAYAYQEHTVWHQKRPPCK